MPENNDFNSALGKIMAMCAQREYCVADIESKLSAMGISRSDAGSIVAILEKEKFIDEARYAKAFVRDKFFQNKWGKFKIAAMLRAKNIKEDIINKALDEIDDDLYISTIRDIMSAHRRVTKAKSVYELKGKLLRFGLSKGFESNLLYDILNDMIND